MTSEELNAWLAGLDIPSKESQLYLVEINNGKEAPGSITAYDANGEIALASSDTVSQIATYYAEGEGGNGVVWGKV